MIQLFTPLLLYSVAGQDHFKTSSGPGTADQGGATHTHTSNTVEAHCCITTIETIGTSE